MTDEEELSRYDGVVVRMEHMRRLGYCSGGVRAFFQRHSLDYSAFLQDGIPGVELARTGDGMAIAVVEVAALATQEASE